MGKTHSCKYFRLMADEYIEGELTEAEMREFEAHIAECEECRRELEKIRALNAILRSNRERMPEGLHSRIMSAIEAEPKRKPRGKSAFFRTAAISAACVMLCLSLTVFITLLPMWRGNTGGNADLPADPDYAMGGVTSEECDTATKSESISSPPTDGYIEAESAEISEEMQTPEEMPDEADTPSTEPTAEMAPSTEAEQLTPETAVAETTAEHYFKIQTNSAADAPAEDGNVPHTIYFSQAESANAPGETEITLAILIVSGLLAIASFVAFLISLSSIRNKPINKGDQK